MIDVRNAAVGAVIESAVDPDGAIYAVNHAAIRAPKGFQARGIEIEGVEEAGPCGPGNGISLDPESAFLHFIPDGPHELVPAARWWRGKLVE